MRKKIINYLSKKARENQRSARWYFAFYPDKWMPGCQKGYLHLRIANLCLRLVKSLSSKD